MTLFEYISIATSLMLSFSLARALSNLAPIFASEHRYWVHSTWVVLLLGNHATLFWQLWLYQDVTGWTLTTFVLLLIGPITLLIAASLLVPVGAVSDYRSYFESIRRPAYCALIVMQLQQLPLLYLLFDIPVFHVVHVGSFVIVACFVAALVAKNHKVDMALVVLFVIAVVGGLFVANDHAVTRELLQSMRQ